MDLNMMQNQAFRTGCVFTLFFFSWFSNYILIIVAHIICSIVTKSQQSGSTGPLSFSLWTKISLSAQKNSGHHQGNGELLARGHPSWYYPSFATSWDCSQSCCAWCLGILWVFANVIGPLTTSSHHTHTHNTITLLLKLSSTCLTSERFHFVQSEYKVSIFTILILTCRGSFVCSSVRSQ